MDALNDFLERLPYGRTDIIFSQLFSCMLNGQTYPQTIHNQKSHYIKLITSVEDWIDQREPIVNKLRRFLRLRVGISPFRKALITSILIHEGFRVRFIDSVKKMKEIIGDNELFIKAELPNTSTGIYAKLYRARARYNASTIESKRQITDTLRILNVYVLDDEHVDYSVLKEFLQQLYILRWKIPEG